MIILRPEHQLTQQFMTIHILSSIFYRIKPNSQNPNFDPLITQNELQKGLQVLYTAQHPKQHRNMHSTTQFTIFSNFS